MMLVSEVTRALHQEEEVLQGTRALHQDEDDAGL